MDTFPPGKLLPVFIIIGLMIWACIGVWTWAALRKRDGLPVLPVAWRRPVPWRGLDLVLFFLLYAGSPFLVAGAWYSFSDTTSSKASQQTELSKSDATKPPLNTEDSPKAEHGVKKSEKQKQHPLVLLLPSDNPWILGFCFFMAVIFAPLTEEIVFRMFLQGYLEKIDRQLCHNRRRRQIEPRSWFSRNLPWGVIPILATSAFFAMLHFRSEQPAPSTESILESLIIFVISASLSLVLLLIWLRVVRKARLADFGIVVREIPKDALRGTLAFFAVAPLVYGILLAVANLVPEEIAADPIPIFFLSIAFGTIWCRTHRLVPSIVMHMLFNGFSLGMALYMSSK